MYGAPYNKAFENIQFTNDEAYKNTNLPTDPDFIKTDVVENNLFADYTVTNYRKTEFTKNPNYVSKVNHPFYDRLGISDGKGPGRNVMLDDKLTRGEYTDKPADKLNEKVNEIRRYQFLPNRNENFADRKFLVTTSLSRDPQKGFDPGFEIYGKSTRHFNRKPEHYYKKYKI